MDRRTTAEIIKAWTDNRTRIPDEIGNLSRYQLENVMIDFAYRLEAVDMKASYNKARYKRLETNANRRQDYDEAKEARINALRFEEIQDAVRTPIVNALYGVTERQLNKRRKQRP